MKCSVSGPQEPRASLQGSDYISGDGQHNCDILHQQGGQYEIRFSVCPPLEASVVVPPQGNSLEGKTLSCLLECNSRQIVQGPVSDPDRDVPISAGVQSFVLQMGPTTDRSFCNPVQTQTSQICVTGIGSNIVGSRCLESPLGESGCVCLSTSVTTQQGSIQGDGTGLSQNDIDCTGMD